MQNKIFIVVAFSLLCALGIFVFYMNRENSIDNIQKGEEAEIKEEQILVGATIFPIFDIARNIAGEKLEIVQILPNNSSPHNFNPTPRGIQELESAELILSIGHDLDNWVEDFSSALDIESRTLDSGIELLYLDAKHHHNDAHSDENEGSGHEEEEHGQEEREEEGHKEDGHEGEGRKYVDPHYWLSLKNGIIIAENVKNIFIELTPENAELFEENYQNYKKSLEEVIKYQENSVDNFEKREIITFHDAFSYFLKDIDMELVATIEEYPGQEPTIKWLENVENLIKEYNISVLYKEPQFSARGLDVFKDRYGIEILELDPIGGDNGRDTYIKLIEYNFSSILEGLETQNNTD